MPTFATDQKGDDGVGRRIQPSSRKVLAWRLSNTLTTDFCLEALEEAMHKYGRPEIFNTDQGSQFTDEDWITMLTGAGVAISMDGKGRWIDNVFIARLRERHRGAAFPDSLFFFL